MRIARLYFGWLVVLMAGTACGACAPPYWWSDPHQHDRDDLYFKAKGQSVVSEQEARNDAMGSIKEQLSGYIRSHVAPDGSVGEAASDFDLHEVESFREKSCRESLPGRWTVFMLGRYPRAEYNKIREKIALAEKLQRQWAVAQSELNRGETPKAEIRLRWIIGNYDQALLPTFALEQAKLELARLYLKQSPPSVLKARKWIEDVNKSTGEKPWREQAEELGRNLPPITLHDAFGDRKVGVFCYVRDAEPIRASSELAELASIQFAAARVDHVPMASRNLGLEAAVFSGGEPEALLARARESGIDAVFAALLEIDPAKTGREEVIDGDILFPLGDATVYYAVLRVADGQLACFGQFHGHSSDGAKRLLASVFNHPNHLPKYIAAIAETFAAASD